MPFPQELAEIEAAAHAKKGAPKAWITIDAGAGGGGDAGPALGKRKRVAKDCGDDFQCYGEALVGGQLPLFFLQILAPPD